MGGRWRYLDSYEDEEAPVPEVEAPAPEVEAPVPEVEAPVPEVETPAPECWQLGWRRSWFSRVQHN